MTVYFVGAGPGDPDLLTIKALRILKTCQCCIWTGSLINPDILLLLPKHATIYDSSGMNLDEIISCIQRENSLHMNVVRLHTGDPTIYSTLHEQVQRLNSLQIPFEVIPGISAFQATAADLAQELTVPHCTQSVIITRMPGRTPIPDTESLEAFAKTKATLCIYLSVDKIHDIVKIIVPYYSRDCPIIVAYKVSWPQQRIISGTLATIEHILKEESIQKTALIIVGNALRKTDTVSLLYDKTFSHSHRMARDI